jgi:DNA-binding XRE family transcriptional regulator
MTSLTDEFAAQGIDPIDAFRIIRGSMGLSQAQLAKILDVAETTVRGWEKNGPPLLAMMALECLQRRAAQDQTSRPLALETQIATLNQAAQMIQDVARKLRQ